MDFDKNNLLLYNNKYISYMKFIFIQDGERDIQHPIVEFSFSSCSTILFYLLHLPKMKHIKQLVTLLIQPGSYPEYIQLLKDIITTHVFPNVTTLKITYHYKFVLFSEFIIQLMDTIIYDKDILTNISENVVFYPEISEAILNTNNTNYFTIQDANSFQYKILNELKNCMKDINYNELQTLFINFNPDEDEEYEYDSDDSDCDYEDDEDDSEMRILM
ncbi:hypothetical protein WA158_005916 [Blastocystis sp. Blastoise]